MMDLYWKTAAGVLVAVILMMTLQKQEKDVAALLGMAVTAMTVMAALTFLEPVLDFLWRLQALSRLGSGVLESLLKMVGIGLTTELASLICQDSGSAGLARGMQLLGTAVILTLSLPMFESLMELVQTLLGEL